MKHLSRRSGIARIIKGSQFYLHTLLFIRKRNEPYTCLRLDSRNWYLFTDSGGMEG